MIRNSHPVTLILVLLVAGFTCAASSLNAQTLTWNPNPETNIAGYQVSQGTQSGVYGSPIAVGNVTSYQPQGIDWTKRAYFVVQAINTAGLVSNPSNEAVWTPASVTSFNSLTSSAAYPLVAGTAVTWTASATNNLGPVEYRFYLYKKTAWVMVQDYGPSTTYTWTPAAADAGTPYFVQVWARAVGSTAQYEAWRGTFSFNVVPAPLTLTADVDFPTPPGNQITWTAVLGTPPAGAVEYQFQVIDTSKNTTTILRSYSSSNQAQWVPASAGSFIVQGLERKSGSTAQYDLIVSTPALQVAATPLTITSFSTPTTFPAPTGTPITWTARVQGGMSGPIQYEFWLYSTTSGWQNAQPYGPSETFTWTPTWAQAGNYAVQVWVRSNGSTASYDAYAGTNLFQIQRAPVHLTTPTLFPVAVGTPVTWTASVADSSVTMQYEFWVYSNLTAQWVLGQAYGSQNTFIWTPTVVDSYSLQVYARQVGSTANYDVYTQTGVMGVVSGPASMVSLTSNVALPASAGTTITWTAGATGGTAPVQYQFWRQDGGTWIMVQDYSSQNTYSWTTTAADVGQHAIQARVRSTGSSSAYESQMSTGVFQIQ
jgi:cell wall-associated protease